MLFPEEGCSAGQKAESEAFFVWRGLFSAEGDDAGRKAGSDARNFPR